MKKIPLGLRPQTEVFNYTRWPVSDAVLGAVDIERIRALYGDRYGARYAVSIRPMMRDEIRRLL